MYKLDLPIDPKEAAKLARKHRLEEERKKRIFDPKTRLIGIDVNCLNKQIEEKKFHDELEKRREAAYDNDLLHNAAIASMLYSRIEKDKQALAKQLEDFRNSYQKPENRREFDLYDPNGLKKELPARVGDDDPRCSISGLQKFDGEDLQRKDRLESQKEQMRNWLYQQNEQRKQSEYLQQQAEKMYHQKLLQLDKRGQELKEAERLCRQAVDIAIKNYNEALLKQQEFQKMAQKQQETENNLTEISNAIYGDFLSENPDVARSALGPKHVLCDRWKGMTPEQIAEIRRIQAEQVREKETLTEQEKQLNKEWDNYLLCMSKAAALKDNEQHKNMKKTMKQIAEENQQLASQQKTIQDYLNREVFKGTISEGYFDQFNTSTR